MATQVVSPWPEKTSADNLAKLLERYGCGPIEFVGGDNAVYSGTFSMITLLVWMPLVSPTASKVLRAQCATSLRSVGFAPKKSTTAKNLNGCITFPWSF